MLNVPPSTRVPFGTVKIDGKELELFVSIEWANYLESLNKQVLTNTTALAENAQHAALLGDSAGESDYFPAPPGPRGPQGEMGPALFLLQDEGCGQEMLNPPSIDGVYVPLSSKDATDGVPALTQFKLNLKSAAGTVTSWITNAATTTRTWVMPNKDGTVAVLSDFAAPPAIGATTPAAGAFTTLTTTAGTLALTSDFAAPPAIGSATPATGSFTTLTATGQFGCNGKPPQAGAVSGGTLAGVITALVANGILTS